MTPQEILDYNKRCAEFLGADIFEKDGRWEVRNWSNPKDRPNKVISSSPITIWGTKEETYNKILLELLNEKYGRWGKFHSDWNWIMEVKTKICQLNIVDEFDTEYDSVAKGFNCRILPLFKDSFGPICIAIMPTEKEAVVEAINQFLIWYETAQHRKIT